MAHQLPSRQQGENSAAGNHGVNNFSSGHGTYGFGPYLHPSLMPTYNQAWFHGQSAGNTSTLDDQTQYLQFMMVQMQNINAMQTKEIVELRIKIAVLEKEVERVGKDKDTAVNSLGVVVGALTRNQTSIEQRHHELPGVGNQRQGTPRAAANASEDNISKLKDLEREIESLRQRNKYLSREIKANRGTSGRGNHEESASCVDDLPPGPKVEDKAEQRIPSTPAPKPHTEARSSPLSIHRRARRDSNKTSTINPQHISSGNLVPAPDSEGKGPVNLPTLQPQISNVTSNYSIVNTVADNTDASSMDLNMGFKTLDELFTEDDDDEEVLPKPNASKNIVNASPNVLKVGGNTKGAFTGNGSELSRTVAGCRGGSGGFNSRGYGGGQYTPPHLQHQPTSSITDWSSFGSIDYGRPKEDESLGSSLWANYREREAAIVSHQISVVDNKRYRKSTSERMFPKFFKYGVQYSPSPSDGEYMRTLTISNLSKDVKLRDVLSRVRGGQVISATLCNTYPIVGGMTVRLVFEGEYEASMFEDFCVKYPMTCFSDSEDLPRTATVDLVLTPTYPHKDHRLANQSRCLVMENIPESFSVQALEIDIACNNAFRAESLLDIWVDEKRDLHLEFSSIDAAGSAMAILLNWHEYRIFHTRYESDPCEGPLEELLDEPCVRRRSSLKSDVCNYGSHSEGDKNLFKTYDGEREVFSMPVDTNWPGSAKRFWPEVPLLQGVRGQDVQIPSLKDRKLKEYSWIDGTDRDWKPSLPNVKGSSGTSPLSTEKQSRPTSGNSDDLELPQVISHEAMPCSDSSVKLEPREQSFSSDSSLFEQATVDRLIVTVNKVGEDSDLLTGTVGIDCSEQVLGIEYSEASIKPSDSGMNCVRAKASSRQDERTRGNGEVQTGKQKGFSFRPQAESFRPKAGCERDNFGEQPLQKDVGVTPSPSFKCNTTSGSTSSQLSPGFVSTNTTKSEGSPFASFLNYYCPSSQMVVKDQIIILPKDSDTLPPWTSTLESCDPIVANAPLLKVDKAPPSLENVTPEDFSQPLVSRIPKYLVTAGHFVASIIDMDDAPTLNETLSNLDDIDVSDIDDEDVLQNGLNSSIISNETANSTNGETKLDSRRSSETSFGATSFSDVSAMDERESVRMKEPGASFI